MKRSYDWQTVENKFKEELRDKKTIMTFGTIGSLNLDTDIDVFITKKPDASTAEYYNEMHTMLDTVDGYLKKEHDQKLIRFTRLCHQEEFLYLGNYKPGDLALHVMSYNSLEHASQVWSGDLPTDDSIEKILRKSYNCIYGDIEMIFSPEFSRRKKYDNLIYKIEEQDRINSNFPEPLLVKTMNHLYKYVQKYVGITAPMQARDKEEVREMFYKIMDILDEKNKEEK